MFITRLVSDGDGKVHAESTEFVTWEQFDELLRELAMQTYTETLDGSAAQTQPELSPNDTASKERD